MPNGQHRPAVVTDADSRGISLYIFAVPHLDFVAPFATCGTAEGTAVDTWHWPEKEPS